MYKKKILSLLGIKWSAFSFNLKNMDQCKKYQIELKLPRTNNFAVYQQKFNFIKKKFFKTKMTVFKKNSWKQNKLIHFRRKK